VLCFRANCVYGKCSHQRLSINRQPHYATHLGLDAMYRYWRQRCSAIIRTFTYYQEGERLKFVLYALLSSLLLFTAAIVSNIESVQQTLNLTLDSAYTQVFVHECVYCEQMDTAGENKLTGYVLIQSFSCERRRAVLSHCDIVW
jgi:hypothetical protein